MWCRWKSLIPILSFLQYVYALFFETTFYPVLPEISYGKTSISFYFIIGEQVKRSLYRVIRDKIYSGLSDFGVQSLEKNKPIR